MLSFEVKQHIGEMLQSLGRSREALDLISRYASQYDDCVSRLTAFASGGASAQEAVGDLQNDIAMASAFPEGHSFRVFFLQLEHLQRGLLSLRAIEGEVPLFVTGTIGVLENLSKAVDQFLNRQSIENSLQLFARAKEANVRLMHLESLLVVFEAAIFTAPSSSNDEAILDIVLSAKDDVQGFVRRLEALGAIYSELCRLFQMSELDWPLRIRKIESGSLWGSFLGEPRVIAFIADAIVACAGFVHRNYLREGKLASIPRNLETLDGLLDIRARMQAQGLGAQLVDDELRRSAVLLAGSFTDLLQGQASVRVNGRLASVGDDYMQQRVAADQQLQIEGPAPNTEARKGEDERQ